LKGKNVPVRTKAVFTMMFTWHMYLASGSYSKLSFTPRVFSIFSCDGRPGSFGPAPKNCSLRK
jgi:hypothetical protein